LGEGIGGEERLKHGDWGEMERLYAPRSGGHW
jgi:hypothetical protein